MGKRRAAARSSSAVSAAIALAILLLVAGVAGIAQAQEAPVDVPSEPGAACKEATGQDLGCDNEVTPVAKDADQETWTAFGGAKFGGEGELIAPQAPATVDFYTVRFRGPSLGFAGGAACPDDTPFEQLHDDYCGPSREAGVPRVPVIYRYLDPDGEAGELVGFWSEHYRGTGRGYVGSIAFTSPAGDEAIAVGGSGNYPRRELGRAAGETDEQSAARDLEGEEPNAAGRARVWTHAEDDWDEETGLPQTPQQGPMRGFTAVDCSPRLQEGKRCLAGAYRQLWLWQAGEFTRAFTDNSTAKPEENWEVDYPARFRFRVRSIRFAPGPTTPFAGSPQAIAVTSGCCSDLPVRNRPSVLQLFTNSATTDTTETNVLNRAVVTQPEEGEAEKTYLADSYYSICRSCGGDVFVASPGGPEPQPPAVEPPARISGNRALSSVYDSSSGRARYPLPVGIRLVAIDGDSRRARPESASDLMPGTIDKDGQPDWAVGERTSSGQGLAYTTAEGPTPLMDVMTCPTPENIFDTNGTQVDAAIKCQPEPEGAIDGTRSKRLFEFPTYALNAFALTAGTDTAWAAGDRGALWRLGAGGGAGAGEEAQPPRLGTRQPGELTDTSAYDGLQPPASGSPGPVPPLDGHDEVRLDEPQLLPSGAPFPTSKGPREDVSQIVMSRDGSEGWALGAKTSSTTATTLYHYLGGRWSRCETGSATGVFESDVACEALAALRNPSPGQLPDAIMAAARIPLERDSDPSNDDEFEVMAIATKGTGDFQVLRYRAGRWSVDDALTTSLNASLTSATSVTLAFSAPGDGWLVAGWQYAEVHHFDGERWTKCTDANREACSDPGGLVPVPNVSGAASQITITSSGGRLYMAGTRFPSQQPFVGATTGYPMILSKDRDGSWSNDPDSGGFDPGCAPNPAGRGCLDSGKAEAQGGITAISAAPAQGGDVGWAVGTIGGRVAGTSTSAAGGGVGRKVLGAGATLLRLEPRDGGGSAWSPWAADERELGERLADPGDASTDYLPFAVNPQPLAIPGAAGDADAWIFPRATGFPGAPMLEFRDGRWQAAPAPFSTVYRTSAGGTNQLEAATALPQAAAADGQGGYWLAVRQAGTAIGEHDEQIVFYHHTDRAPRAVFSEAPHPIREEITAAAGGPDGSFWVATASSTVYRYDRVTGWNRVPVPGWDPGRTVTRPSEATAIAIGPGGEGILVGEGGRMADVSPVGVRLDEAAGAALCQVAGSGPCGTGLDLRAAAIAPTGETLVGGDRRALLWRSRDGEFHSIAPPPTTADATITGISFPQANQAFLTTDLGQVYVGDPAAGNPGWHVENRDPKSGLLESAGSTGMASALRAIAVDGSGRGYAVGEDGVVIERTGDAGEPWRRVESDLKDDFYSVALPPAGGGALIGGADGVIYTLSGGSFEVARPADPWNPLTAAPVTDPRTARILGLAVLPGADSGETEAWAVSQIPPGRGRDPAPGGVLHYSSNGDHGGLDPVSRAEPLPDVPDTPAAVTLAAFGRSECQPPGAGTCPEPLDSNLASDSVVRRVRQEIEELDDRTDGPVLSAFTGGIALAAGDDNPGSLPLETNLMHRRWAELVAARFAEADMPLFAAVGVHDLSQVKNCANGGCTGTQQAGAGTTGPWSDAMRNMPAPWGTGPTPSADGVSYAPVEVPGLGDSPAGGGASTHYALDVIKGDRKLLRLVFADNSLRSIDTSEPNQNPLEVGGQSRWLEQVLCREGTAAGCTRLADEPAVVVANTPTHSYGPGVLQHTAADAATFERTLFTHDVSALIGGRLGWNGLYYARGVEDVPVDHVPAPGGEYPGGAPEPLPGGELLPGVVAASAGGRFGPDRDGAGSAAQGYWRGYTVVRVPEDGDPAKVLVEQRPVFDWISIRPAPGTKKGGRMVRPSKKLALEGFGREVAGTDAALRYDEITSDAITHRYDLLVADPAKPWLPQQDQGAGDDATEFRSAASERIGEEDPCGPYLCLDPKVGTVDPAGGVVKGGKGNYPRTYAIALLSVGAHSATYPLVFEPRASFQPPRPTPVRPPALPPPPANPTQPPQPPPPTVEALVPPVLPTLTAAQPPAPPVPPTPPPAESQAPLDLNLAPTALDVTPPTAVSQPPTPPVNPAPPSGARREARQRQAAAQKSGADSAEEGSDAQDSGGDLAQSPPTDANAASRHDFTALAHREQPSAWARDALLGGGIGLAALILALGLRTARPTPRRREPELPAPAWSRGRRR